MLTLKIHWMRYEEGEVVDETTLFVPADRVLVHGEIDSMDKMHAWKGDQYQNYSIVNDSTEAILPSRIIEVDLGEDSTWYLASRAWVLGPDGSTIERVAP